MFGFGGEFLAILDEVIEGVLGFLLEVEVVADGVLEPIKENREESERTAGGMVRIGRAGRS